MTCLELPNKGGGGLIVLHQYFKGILPDPEATYNSIIPVQFVQWSGAVMIIEVMPDVS